uniref:Capsid protein n=1 Tax=Betatorquevirus 004A TaxID=3163405 RepID=A0AAU7STJ7_9VIRU
MPYYRRWRKRRYWRHRRPRPYRRRPRKIIRRRYRRPYYWVRRRRFLKKLFKITLKQFQPKKVIKCKIQGEICLFQAGKGLIFQNYAQYQDSFVPEGEPGGGGWSALVFNLGGLYQENQKLHNRWSKSNKGLPLARYTGCKFKFWRSWDTDYIIHWQTCPPMTDTELLHLNAQPFMTMLTKNHFIVPNLTRPPYTKKPYFTKKFPPPSQITNKWYFQQDLCNTGLLLLTTSAMSLDQWFLPNNELSNNITLTALNTTFFQNSNFQVRGTRGYQPKPNLYIYGQGNGTSDPHWNELIYLGNAEWYQEGNKMTNENLNTFTAWGNIFHEQHIHADTRVYYSTTFPTTQSLTKEATNITKLDYIYHACRYNPNRDTGDGNEVFFVSNSINPKNIFDPPKDPDLHIYGYPLWLIAWGWADWQKKLAKINQIEQNYIMVAKTKFINPPLPAYVFLDNYFTNPEKYAEHYTETDKKHFYPKYEYQKEQWNLIAQSGPAAPKIDKSQSIQARAHYSFFFKWGGCPAPMEEVKDPCQQGTYPIPNYQLQASQIQDPKTDKRSFIWDFDERRETITPKAAKRLKHISTFDTVFTDRPPFDLKLPEKETEEETSSEEEIQTSLSHKVDHLRLKHRLLRRKLNRLIKQKLSTL